MCSNNESLNSQTYKWNIASGKAIGHLKVPWTVDPTTRESLSVLGALLFYSFVSLLVGDLTHSSQINHTQSLIITYESPDLTWLASSFS